MAIITSKEFTIIQAHPTKMLHRISIMAQLQLACPYYGGRSAHIPGFRSDQQLYHLKDQSSCNKPVSPQLTSDCLIDLGCNGNEDNSGNNE